MAGVRTARRVTQGDATGIQTSRWRQVTAALIVLVLGLAATALLAAVSASAADDQARKVAEQRAGRVSERLVSSLTPMDSVNQATRAFVLSTPTGADDARVEGFMQRLYERWSGFRSLGAAPGNVVTAVVPANGNEEVLGLRYEDNPQQWVDVQRAMATGTSVLSGPVDLVQGGRGFVYRTPVFLADDSFWGTISAVVDTSTLLRADEQDVAVVDATAPAVPVVGSSTVLTGEHESVPVTVLGRQFTVAASHAASQRTAAAIIAVAGTITSVLLAALVYLLTGAIGRERALARLMGDLSAQAPGVLLQMRQRPGGGATITYASLGLDRLVERAGYSNADPGTERAVLAQLVHPDDQVALAQAQEESAQTDRPWHQRFRIVHGDGSVHWLLIDAQPHREPSGDVVWHGWVGDVTDDVADEAALRVSASLFDVSRDGVAILDADGNADDVNAGFTAMTGFSADDVRQRPFTDYVRGYLADEVLADLWEQLHAHGYWRGEITGRTKDGHVRTDAATATAVRDRHGRLSHYVVVLDNMDVTRDDSVTGLPHARTLEPEVARATTDATAAGEQVALVVVGLDQFRQVNDSYGHRVGDAVLRAIARRLRSVMPPAGALVRLRGDEFALLMPSMRDVAEVESVVAAALTAVGKPVTVGRHVVRVTATAGVAVYPDDTVRAADLVSSANQAMRAAKLHGPNQIRYFTADLQATARDRAALVDDFGAVLRRGRGRGGGALEELTVVFQPVVSMTTNATHHAEALTRWNHPVRGAVPPDVFIPLAEQAGLVADLGDFVFSEVVRALAVLSADDPTFCIAVNLSPLELREPADRHTRRLDLLRDAGLSGDRVIAEITEGTLLSQDATIDANMAIYRDAGVRFAIDDFGTGYSSLAYLMKLDVEFLKIDRSFVDVLAPDSDGLALCEAIIAMAKIMGIQVIAEGVETATQESLLGAAGCDFVQGFRHSPPIPLIALIDWLALRPDLHPTTPPVQAPTDDS